MIDTQFASGYASSSSVWEAFAPIMGAAPSLLGQNKILQACWLETPLGPMLAIADESRLYLLEFVDRRGLEGEVERMRQKLKAVIIPGRTNPVDSVERELNSYFAKGISDFKTTLAISGSPFQKQVWEQLQKIPAGATRSYLDIALALGRPTAYRAVAQANASNQLAIIIPCHRVINANGALGGYAGGLARKQWLLDHEKRGSGACQGTI